jgi:hypothetical protein
MLLAKTDQFYNIPIRFGNATAKGLIRYAEASVAYSVLEDHRIKVFLLTIRITALIDQRLAWILKYYWSIYKTGLQHHLTNIIISALFHNKQKRQNLRAFYPLVV